MALNTKILREIDLISREDKFVAKLIKELFIYESESSSSYRYKGNYNKLIENYAREISNEDK